MARGLRDDRRLATAVREALAAAVDSDDPGEFRYVNLRAIADAVGLPQRDLVAAARRGDFAPVLQITERTVVVRVRDLREWEERAEVSPARAAAVAGYLDDRPAEPFAGSPPGMTMAATRSVRGRGHRGAESVGDGRRSSSAGKAPARLLGGEAGPGAGGVDEG